MRNPAVCMLVLSLAGGCSDPVAPGGDTGADGSAGDDAAVTMDVVTPDARAVGPMGGTVDRFRFAVYGDVRPPNEDDTAHYPNAIIGGVMDGIQGMAPHFAIATGDYMFARSEDVAGRQIDLLTAAEARYTAGTIFHALGNHECTGSTTSNCPNGNETGNMRVFRSRLNAAQPGPYYDFVVATSMGDAHFIVTAPNAWSSSQDAWLTRVIAQQARYTFVVAHEPPTATDMGPGSDAVETAVRGRAGGVTLRLYGHTHDYRRIAANAIIAGNAGAPLNAASDTYGFVLVEQQADGNVQVSAYDLGQPPMLNETFVLHPDGTAAR